jgi:hypothetical protein
MPYFVCEYSANGIGADTTSTDLIELQLPGVNLDSYGHRNIPNLTSSGSSYIIDLKGFSISSNSTNFDVSILNINDSTGINTINEVAKYTGINLSESDQSFETFIIRNRDTVLTNKIYLYIVNHALIATGIIRIELVYISIQDREF